jgi:hypothetical protein
VNIRQIQALVAQGQYRLTFHAQDKMDRLRIAVADLEDTFASGEIIETREDEFGYECHLVLGERFNGDQIHIACKVVSGMVQVNTVYFPDPEFWETNGKTHRR